MHRKIIGSSSAGGYGLCLQWGQSWFEFRSCNGHCPPQYNKTCSVPPGEQMSLLSVFFTWLENEQPSPYDTTKTDRLNWFLKEVPNAFPTLRNALKWHFQIFSNGYIVSKQRIWYVGIIATWTSAIYICPGRLHSCPKSPPRLIILVIYVITFYDELSADAIIVDGWTCNVINPILLTYLSLMV